MKKRIILPAAVLLILVLLFFFLDGISIRDKFDKLKGLFLTKEEVPLGDGDKGAQRENPSADGPSHAPVVRVIKNAYIFSSDESRMRVYFGAREHELYLSGRLQEPIENVIADITMVDGDVTGLKLKRDTIKGKVLRADTKEIELYGYGVVPLADVFHIYQTYDGFREESSEKLLVGLTDCEFVMEDGKICVAFLNEKPALTDIRVVLQTSGYQGLYHEEITVTSDKGFRMIAGEGERSYAAGESLTLRPQSFATELSRRTLVPAESGGRLYVSSIKRASGTPAYRGTLEVSCTENGLLLVNELPLEEYLYAVLPSEMPESFHFEARKAQAVCARTYAYAKMQTNRYAAYGANVDDSVACQVYNNIGETDGAILAVKSTHGQILRYEGKAADCYYFSTSCGHTASVQDVFAGAKETRYLTGSPCLKADVRFQQKDLAVLQALLSEPTNAQVASFLNGFEPETYDSESPWFRWQTFLSLSSLEKGMTSILKERYAVVPEQILTYDEQSGTFVSKPIGALLELKSIQVFKRGTGGIVTELIVVGSERIFLVKNEYNIRAVLSPLSIPIVRSDGETVMGGELLPSAFVLLTRGRYQEKDGYLCSGGGYGHGVGMSQYGADAMAKEGRTAEEILSSYYPLTELVFMEEQQK